jgi:hypothetical protein
MRAEIIEYGTHVNLIVADVDLNEDGTARVSSTRDGLLEMLNDHILDTNGDKLTTDDGEAFIHALPYQFTGSRLRARVVGD